MTRKLSFWIHLTVKESELFAKPCLKIWQSTSVKYSHAHSFSMIINASQGKNFSTVILRYFSWFVSFRHTFIIYLGLAPFSCFRSRYGHVIILMPWRWCHLRIKHVFYIIWPISIHLALFVLLKYFSFLVQPHFDAAGAGAWNEHLLSAKLLRFQAGNSDILIQGDRRRF